MYRLNQIAALLAGTLLAFGPAAMGQGQDCSCKQGCSCEQGCNCKHDCRCKQEASSAGHRQKPAANENEATLANQAAEVVSAALSPDRLQNAKAVVVIPNVKKGAFIVGGRWGRGLMTMRGPDGHWLPPAFIQITGRNSGLQAGYQSTDLVLIFTDEEAIKSLLKGSRLTLNADASAAAPSFGRKIDAGAPVRLKGGIYSYSRTKGVFAGASPDGAVIKVDDQSDAKVYGKGVSGEEILLSRSVERNAAVAPFLDALESPGGKS
jgi:lipid-binding SYLF domain-containing protein